jgi:hypothetical protein
MNPNPDTNAVIPKSILVQRILTHLATSFTRVIGMSGNNDLIVEAAKEPKRAIITETVIGILSDDPQGLYTENEAGSIEGDVDAFVFRHSTKLQQVESVMLQSMQSIRNEVAMSRSRNAPQGLSVKMTIGLMLDEADAIRNELEEAIQDSAVCLEPAFLPDYVVKKADELLYCNWDFSAEESTNYFVKQFLFDCIRWKWLQCVNGIRYDVGNYFCGKTVSWKLRDGQPRMSREAIHKFIQNRLPKKNNGLKEARNTIDFSSRPIEVLANLFDHALVYCWDARSLH